MPILIYFGKSKRKDKKFVAVFRNPTRTINFGSPDYEDYTTHHDPRRKLLYILRHFKNENWDNPLTAGTLSRYVLWNKPDLEESLDDYIQRFGIEDRRKFKI